MERPVHRIHLYEVRLQYWRNNRNHAKVESIEDMGAKPPYLLQDMGEMEEEETGATRVQLYHKEEAKARIQANAKDRAGLRRKLDSCIDPMDSKAHPEGSIVNIVSGKLAPASVNVENAVMIGDTMLEDYEKTWPEEFNSTISKKVETMAASCKFVLVTPNCNVHEGWNTDL